MYFTVDDTSQINDLLNRIGIKLQLNKSRRERVEQSYNALCEWIKGDKEYFSNYELEFYAQGSYKIGTTVKPMSGEEYDLDFVLEVKSDWKNENPIQILDNLEKRLRSSEIYINKVERKTRCIRVNYANDFHIDILPGMPENNLLHYSTSLKVPDRDKKDWTFGNPKGYANWFDNIAKDYDEILLEKHYASVEPLPDQIPYDIIEPLKRIVQLMKRYRDVYYNDSEKSGPSSIIITTLAAINYNKETSEYDGILNILYNIKRVIQVNGESPIEIYNPTNDKEKLSEKWDNDIELYMEFCSFIESFYITWKEIKEVESFEEKSEKLKMLFGESVSNDAIKEQAEYINKLREHNMIGISTDTGIIKRSGALGTMIKKVPKNTFYGI